MNTTEERTDLTLFNEKIQQLRQEISTVIIGQTQAVDLLLTAILDFPSY